MERKQSFKFLFAVLQTELRRVSFYFKNQLVLVAIFHCTGYIAFAFRLILFTDSLMNVEPISFELIWGYYVYYID